MSGVCVSLGPIRFDTVISAMQKAGVRYQENNPYAVLVWHDQIKDIDYFKYLKPWQVVNRIPSMNVLCRKASFTRLIQKIQPFFPTLYSFMPKSWILPFQNSSFIRAVAKGQKRYIVKPDGGSLGQGITIIEPGCEYTPDETLAVGQEYISSYLLENTKFDLRIYALVVSITPLKIYLYNEALARFCSEETGKNTITSQITSVAINHRSEPTSLVFPRMEALGIDTKALWHKIEEVVGLTIISAHGFLAKSEAWQCPSNGYPRCFQVLGFDVLLDEDLNPHVLEVNYRPSLEAHCPAERRMKEGVIHDAIRIGAPLAAVQSAVLSKRWGWNEESWSLFVRSNSQLHQAIRQERHDAVANSNFKKIFPTKDPERQIWYKVLEKVDSLPIEYIPGFKMYQS